MTKALRGGRICVRWAGGERIDLAFVAEKEDSLRPVIRQIMLEVARWKLL